MKTITQKAYTIEELEKLDYRAYESAYDNWVSKKYDDDYLRDEIKSSVKALAKFLGLAGARIASNYVFTAGKNVDDLSGVRAETWLENNLFSKLRIKPTVENRKKAAAGGEKIGHIKSCPFTGICYDESLLDYIRNSVADGMTIGETFAGLWDEADRILEEEREYLNSEEYFKQECSDFDRYFDDTGREI